jgi:P-type E1-E2 ATPase
MGAVVVATIFLAGEVRGARAVFDVLILGAALSVAAVPEGLPAVVTAALSIGVQRMARRNAIMRRLAPAETLGPADVIAPDKTGTLTRDGVTVRRVVTAVGCCGSPDGSRWVRPVRMCPAPLRPRRRDRRYAAPPARRTRVRVRPPPRRSPGRHAAGRRAGPCP